MRLAISCGDRPLKFQSTVMTGMSILGKMSVGVRWTTMGASSNNSSASTTKVYGRRSARRTIHMLFALLVDGREAGASLSETPGGPLRSRQPDGGPMAADDHSPAGVTGG